MAKLELGDDEVIVLLNLLERYSKTRVFVIEDPSEQRALWNLTCVLETMDKMNIDNDWQKTVQHAQASLRDDDYVDARFEQEKGRLALWLTPDEIAYLSELANMLERATSEKETLTKIAHRANTTLQQFSVGKDEAY